MDLVVCGLNCFGDKDFEKARLKMLDAAIKDCFNDNTLVSIDCILETDYPVLKFVRLLTLGS